MLFTSWLRKFTQEGGGAARIDAHLAECNFVRPVAGSRAHLRTFPFERVVLDVLADRFLSDENPSWLSPDYSVLTMIGGIPVGRKIYYLMQGSHAMVLIRSGRTYTGLYDLENNVFWMNESDEVCQAHLSQMLRFLVSRRRLVKGYFRKADSGTLRRMVLIGDNRPTHYLSQSINALSRKLVPAVPRFTELGGGIAIVRDWCFIDPREVFPSIASLPAEVVATKQLTEVALEQGLWCQRYAKSGARSNFSTIRAFTDRLRQATAPASDDALTIWVTLDAEKKRFANQVPLIARALEIAMDEARERGVPLRVLWDGWTLGGGVRTERDDRVIDRIEEMVAEIDARVPGIEQVQLYTHSLTEKIGLGGGATAAITTYGTASLITSVIVGVPTLAAHTRPFVELGNYSDPKNHVILTEPDITVIGRHELEPHDREFEVDERAFLNAFEKVLRFQAESEQGLDEDADADGLVDAD